MGALVCTTRWYLIVIGALFDEIALAPDKQFKLPRNEAIHKFDEINCLGERDALQLILEQKLVP